MVAHGLPRPIARALVNRGHATPDAVGSFLEHRLLSLADPFDLPDMATAVERILATLDAGRRVTVYGDYDADGVCATALLVRALRPLAARADQVASFLPSRFDEGYGLSGDGLEHCLKDTRPDLIVTVDCGTHAAEAVRTARAAGVSVVITDHHAVNGTLPDAPVVNPKRDAAHPSAALAGVGVAFKLAHALYKRRHQAGARPAFDLKDLLDLVALGTVADIVPLTAENRVLVRHGLTRIASSRWPGLKALIEVAGLAGRRIGVYEIGFALGPRINAAGRMTHPEDALKLLLTDSETEAQALSRELDDANRERREVEESITREALAQAQATFDPQRHYGLVFGEASWHSGTIGIAAARVMRRYNRPTVLVAFDDDGVGRGSCRGIPDADLMALLEACRPCLEACGGHRLAAGLTVRLTRFEEFKLRFLNACAHALSGLDLRPSVRLDAWVDGAELDDAFLAWLERMEPFGVGNPRPIWGLRAKTQGAVRVLAEKHLRWAVEAGGIRHDAIAFNMADRLPMPADIEIAFHYELNEFRGASRPQLNVQAVRAAQGAGGMS